MKTTPGIFSLCAFADEAGADMGDQIKALGENGIDYIELRGVNGKNITELTVAEAVELKKRLDGSGIKVWSIGSPIGKININDDFSRHLDLFKHTIELAQATGAECIRLFSFYIPKDKDPAAYRDEVIKRLSTFCDYARGSGITLCHENEKGIYGDIASRCLDIHRQVPDLKAVFDPANFIQCGQDTIKAWDMLSPYVKYMHIKDALPDARVVPAGKGDGHISDLLGKYKIIGGKILTLEPHLSVFSGLEKLERDEKASVINNYTYPTNRAAFDAAANALKSLIL